MAESLQKSLNFDILDSMFIDIEKSTVNEPEIILELAHSTTRSAYVKLWSGNLNGEFINLSFNFETNSKINTEQTEAFLEVKCLESLESPKIYPIDFSKKHLSLKIAPTTSWETTEISLYFTHIFPPLKDTSRTFSIKNLKMLRESPLNFCSHILGSVSTQPNTSFMCESLDDVHLSKGKYTLRHSIECAEDIYKLGVVLTSKKNIEHTIIVPLLVDEITDFEILNPEVFTVKVYAFCKKQTKISLSNLAIHTHKKSETITERPKICAVIPSFNCGKYIERSINSLLNQTLPPYAIYVVDDMSSDDTQKRVQGLKECSREKDILLQYVRLEHNSGPYVAKNLVLYNQLDNFDYFALQDADDYSEITRFEKQLNSIATKNQLVSYTFMQRMCGDKLVKNRGLDARRSYATGMFKKQYFEELGFFEAAKFGADDEMFNRACLIRSSNHSVVSKDVLYFAEYRDGSLTNSEEKVSVDSSSDFLSGLRKEYAQSFTERYQSRMKDSLHTKNPFYLHNTTSKKLAVFPQITLNIASYPPRFPSLIEVIKSICGFVESVGGLINICLNNVSSLPDIMKEFESIEYINFIFPKKDVKDNGKFLNIRQGINLWLDDDIIYTQTYLVHMMYKLITTPPNTAMCVHGSNEGSAYSIDRKVRHFRAYYPNTIDCEIAGTGTVAMLITEPFILSRLKKIAHHKTTGMVDLLFALECHKMGVEILNVDKRFSLNPIEQPQNTSNLFSENKSRKELMDSYMETIRKLKSL